MSDVSHGVNAGKTDSGAITPVSVDTGVHFVVGTVQHPCRRPTEK